MTKKIAVINDLSGFGHCSLIAAISVISAMGTQACPLPTALLTAQTGYPHYYLDDYTDKMEIYRQEWQKMGQHFDGIYTGFVASEAQIDQIFHFIDTFYTPDTFLLVDPVMGDDGVKYDMFTPELLRKMKALVSEADIITPNLTELCLLTDADYDTVVDIADTRILVDVIGELASTLLPVDSNHKNTDNTIYISNKNTTDTDSVLNENADNTEHTYKKEKEIIVTGIHCKNEYGEKMIGNLYVSKDTRKLFSFPHVGGSYSGTGDLFASCIAAGKCRGDEIPELIKLAGEFLEQAIKDSAEENVPYPDGTNYEKYLHMLMRK